MINKIKVTKQEVVLVESKFFNACISEAFYKHNPKLPIMMSVEHTKSKTSHFMDWYKHTNQAINAFENFVEDEDAMNKYWWGNESA